MKAGSGLRIQALLINNHPFAEALFNHFRADVVSLELIPGSGGVFEVTVNGEKVYSKLETGDFPDHEGLFVEMEGLQNG